MDFSRSLRFRDLNMYYNQWNYYIYLIDKQFLYFI